MKNKIITLFFATFFILGVITGLSSLSKESKALSIGTALEYTENSIVLLLDNSPVILSNQTKDNTLFSSLTDGDTVLVLHDGIKETYPAQSGAYFVLRLKKNEFDKEEKEKIFNSFTAYY